MLATSSLSAAGTVATLATAATLVNIFPFPTDGALRQRVYRQLIVYAGGLILVAPASTWALLVPTGITYRRGLRTRDG